MNLVCVTRADMSTTVLLLSLRIKVHRHTVLFIMLKYPFKLSHLHI